MEPKSPSGGANVTTVIEKRNKTEHGDSKLALDESAYISPYVTLVLRANWTSKASCSTKSIQRALAARNLRKGTLLFFFIRR